MNSVVYKYKTGDKKSIFGKPFTYNGTKWVPGEGSSEEDKSKKDVSLSGKDAHAFLERWGVEHIDMLGTGTVKKLFKIHGIDWKDMSPKERLQALVKIYGTKGKEKGEPTKEDLKGKKTEAQEEFSQDFKQAIKEGVYDDYLQNLEEEDMDFLLKEYGVHNLKDLTYGDKTAKLVNIAESLKSSKKKTGYIQAPYPGDSGNVTSKQYNELSRYILKDMTPKHEIACVHYATNCWGINNILRGKIGPKDTNDPERDAKSTKQLDDLFKKSPGLPGNSTFFRGISMDPKDLKDILEKKAYMDDGFSSTSTHESISRGFSSHNHKKGNIRVVLEYQLPKGHKAIPIGDLTQPYREEREVILNRSDKMRVTGTRQEGPYVYITVEPFTLGGNRMERSPEKRPRSDRFIGDSKDLVLLDENGDRIEKSSEKDKALKNIVKDYVAKKKKRK